MAWPWTFQANFESGATPAGFDSETDTASKLDFPSYETLAASPKQAPFRGAFCMRAILDGGTTDAFVTEGDINLTLTSNYFTRFYVFFSMDFAGTANDTFNIYEQQSTASVAEQTVSGRIVAATGVINLGIGKVAATSWSAISIERGKWYAVELDTTGAGGGAGTLDVYITREGDPAPSAVSATQVGSLTNLAGTHAVMGIQNHLATTTGTILFDEYAFDDTDRIYPIDDRYPRNVLMTQSGHVFVGPGWVEESTLIAAGAADGVLTLYDTDSASTTSPARVVDWIQSDTALQTPKSGRRYFERGCYAALSGTTPRAVIAVGQTQAYWSKELVRQYALG